MRRPPELEKTNHSVHYTLLIACVLVAFVLGAFLSGFLVSCYCNHTGHKTKKLSKDPEAPIPHALSLRSLAKLNGLLDSQSKDDKLEVSSPKIYNSFFANSKEHHPPRRNGHHAMTMGDLVHPHHHHHHHHLHHSSELSGLPTPDSTPELPIKSMKAFKNQWEKNQNCNNAKEPKSHNIVSRPSSALLHQQVFPYSHGLSNGQPLGHLHPDERKIHNVERVLSQQPYPGYSQKVMEVTSLDELLKHIHEAGGSKNSQLMSPSGLMASGGGQLAFANRIQPQIPETESAPYYSSSTLPRDSLTRRMDVPPDIPPHHQSTLERRHSSQRHSLITAASKMPNGGAVGVGGGGMIPRQHSFSQRNGGPHQPPPLLARMNSTGSACEVHYPLIPNGYLTRQHSYNGEQQEVQHRGAIVRRASSLKPDVPPKPLFIPATSPVNQQGKFNY